MDPNLISLDHARDDVWPNLAGNYTRSTENPRNINRKSEVCLYEELNMIFDPPQVWIRIRAHTGVCRWILINSISYRS